MKCLIIVALSLTTISVSAQSLKPESISLAYIGETVSRPGLKISVSKSLKNWNRSNQAESSKCGLYFSPSVGYSWHKNYQSSFFVLPELNWKREKENGRYRSLSVGLGYLMARIPNVVVFSQYEIEKVDFAYQQVFWSFGYQFGSQLKFIEAAKVSYYVKPQFWSAYSKQQKTKYFFAEVGLSWHFKA